MYPCFQLLRDRINGLQDMTSLRSKSLLQQKMKKDDCESLDLPCGAFLHRLVNHSLHIGLLMLRAVSTYRSGPAQDVASLQSQLNTLASKVTPIGLTHAIHSFDAIISDPRVMPFSENAMYVGEQWIHRLVRHCGLIFFLLSQQSE